MKCALEACGWTFPIARPARDCYHRRTFYAYESIRLVVLHSVHGSDWRSGNFQGCR
jgi:hypothetical protein